jgi:hypothetical protein
MTVAVRRNTLVSLLTLAILGCDASAAMKRFTPADADARARDYIALLARGQVDSAMARLRPEMVTPDARVEYEKMSAILAHQQFDSSRVVGAQVNHMNGIRHTNLTYELHSRGGWFLANVATVDSAGDWMVEGVSAHTLPASLEAQTRFSFVGKSAMYYAWVFFMVLAGVASLGSALFLATRRAMPKHWGWALLALVGAGTFNLDWSSGAFSFRPISVLLGSLAFVRAGPAAPWVITFALPVGAVIALMRYRDWRSAELASAARQAVSPQALDAS